MKVLVVAPRYFPHVGGVEYVVKAVAERLVKGGLEVAVVAGCGCTRPVDEWVGGVYVLRWPVAGAYGIPKSLGALKKRLQVLAEGVDVVHFHNVHNVFVVASLGLVAWRGARLVVTTHYHGSGHSVVSNFIWPFWRRYVARSLRRVDVVHAVSKYEAELLRDHFGVEPVVIEHGVEERLLELEWGPEGYVLYAGRIERYKNVDKLARVVKLLQRRRPELYFRVVGEGSYRPRLISYLERIKVDYVWSPFLPYEEYVDVLRRALAVGNLSIREAFGMTINEAHAVGVPAVVSKPWGLHFAHRPRTLIVDSLEPDDAVAAKLAEFLDDVIRQPRPAVPSWGEVVQEYIKRLYS